MEEAIRRLGELGVEVHISELDVPVWYLGSTLERKLARQAAVYGAVAAACHAQPACFRITTWGFTDRYTWRQPWGASLPLPFDSEYRPKPAWTAIQEAIHPAGTPPPPPPPPAEGGAPAPAAPRSRRAAAAAAAPAAAPRSPLILSAKLRRQRLRTWVERRALAVLVGIGGTQVARVDLVARVRGRVIGRATVAVDEGKPQPVRVLLTRAGSRSLREPWKRTHSPGGGCNRRRGTQDAGDQPRPAALIGASRETSRPARGTGTTPRKPPSATCSSRGRTARSCARRDTRATTTSTSCGSKTTRR